MITIDVFHFSQSMRVRLTVQVINIALSNIYIYNYWLSSESLQPSHMNWSSSVVWYHTWQNDHCIHSAPFWFLASSEYNPLYEQQASSLFCVILPLFMTDSDGVGRVAFPDVGNTCAEGLFLFILRRVLLTDNWSISSMTPLDLCVLSPEVIPASLSFASLLSFW